MTIDELLRTYVDALRDFLSLAADRPDQLTCCSLELPVSDTEGERPWPIDVVFSPASSSDDKGASLTSSSHSPTSATGSARSGPTGSLCESA